MKALEKEKEENRAGEGNDMLLDDRHDFPHVTCVILNIQSKGYLRTTCESICSTFVGCVAILTLDYL